MIIAGQARAHGLILVTHDIKEFEQVPGLLLEDWSRWFSYSYVFKTFRLNSKDNASSLFEVLRSDFYPLNSRTLSSPTPTAS